jgi:hypothetical protein
MVFEIGIGTSQSLDPEKAALEASSEALQNLTHQPTFTFLFSTIHHEKNNGFQKMLNIIYTKIQKNTPLIGGTVTGFMNKSGCYTLGITFLAIYSDELDSEVGIGLNTKRNPINATKDFLKKIALTNYKFKNKLLFLITAGPSYPIIPGMGKLKIVKNRVLSFLLPSVIKFSTLVLQKGLGREQEIAEEIRKELPDFSVFGGSTNDDNNYTRNYQFYFDKVYENTVSGIAISSNLNFKMYGANGLFGTGVKGKINKKGIWDYLVKDFDGQNAQKKYLDANGWDPTILDELIHRKTIYYPIGIYFDDNTLHPYPVPIFTGKEIILGGTARGTNYEFLTTTGKKMIDCIDPLLEKINSPKLLLGISCAVRLETLGKNIYLTRDKLLKKTDNFLLIYAVGETKGEPNQYIHQFQETINFLSIEGN